MTRIAVTGASGFVGRALLPFLNRAGCDVLIVRRDRPADLSGCASVIHLAGIAHRAVAPDEMRAANRDFALAIAAAARAAAVRRFVFVSTINVVAGHRGRALSSDLPPMPLSDYGRSKAEAEQALLALDGIEVVVLRPPLVFGPGEPGNLRSLMRLCATGVPLPFGNVDNRRSMIGVTNLAQACHFLATADSGQVKGRIFHVAEDRPYALRAIIADCRAAMGRPARLFPVPPRLIRGALSALGRGRMADQLLGDLVVDDRTLREAGWQPLASAEGDMAEMARAAK